MPHPRSILILILASALLGPARPATALDRDEARHLLARTGFAPLPQEIEALLPLSQKEAVALLLAGVRQAPVTPLPDWADDPLPRRRLDTMDEAAKKDLQREVRRNGSDLRTWWYQEMLATPSPLSERLTLLWSGRFTSSLRAVKAPQLLLRQNLLLREHALGNFGTLLHAIARDPAMILYLDNQSNRKDAPNENFARELMELFTLGEGHYTETDVKEAARAFTGWKVDRQTGAFRFVRFQHDFGVKTVLGTTGPLDGDDVIDLLLARDETLERVVELLWGEFVGGDLPSPRRAELVRTFRRAGLELQPLLSAILLSPEFRASSARGTLVKSPVDLVAGTCRLLGMEAPDGRALVLAGRALEQDLFAPPNVKGWPTGTEWITSATLLAREETLRRLISWSPAHPAPLVGVPVGQLPSLLLPVSPAAPLPKDAAPRAALEALLLDPAYQLR